MNTNYNMKTTDINSPTFKDDELKEYIEDSIKDWKEKITDKIIWPNFNKKINKFKPFLKFNQTETKLILREVFL